MGETIVVDGRELRLKGVRSTGLAKCADVHTGETVWIPAGQLPKAKADAKGVSRGKMESEDQE